MESVIKNNITKCNNCEGVFIDRNPQVNAKLYKTKHNTPELILLGDKEHMFWGCPICKTDSYLTDYVSKEDVKKVTI